MGSHSQTVVDSVDAERAQSLVSEIHDHRLPPVLDELVTDYQALTGARPPFVWKWVHRLAPKNTLPCVAPAYRNGVPIDKSLTILYITLLDDVLERNHDRATFRAAAAVPFTDHTPERTEDIDVEYVAFVERVWETLLERLRRAPRFEAYDRLFRFDLKQSINAIEYSYLVIQQPAVATVTDLTRYESHNMGLFAYADIDMMHTEESVSGDFSALREAIWHAQQMSRIGNWLSTWRRELREGDYSSGIVVYALENGIVSERTLQSCDRAPECNDSVIERIEDAHVETVFLDRWDGHLDSIREIDDERLSMDLEPFVRGLREVLRYHLATVGLK